jgi:hypothetical protein
MAWTLREESYGDADPMSEGGDISEDLSNQPINDPDD